jgi:hypothetical protein
MMEYLEHLLAYYGLWAKSILPSVFVSSFIVMLPCPFICILSIAAFHGAVVNSSHGDHMVSIFISGPLQNNLLAPTPEDKDGFQRDLILLLYLLFKLYLHKSLVMCVYHQTDF